MIISGQFGDFVIWRGALHFNVAVDGVVLEGCDVVGVRLVDFEAMVLELDYSFGSCFSLELCGVQEWTYSRVVSIVDVIDSFLRGAGVSDVSWVK